MMLTVENCYVTTTAGETFGYKQFAQLAHLIWLRFGKDDEAAVLAWRRLHQNNATLDDFKQMRSWAS